jgi:hypothetical protein
MFLRLLPPLLMVFALPAVAQDVPCDLYNGDEVCVPVLACVEEKGLWFDGRAYGSREGRIEGEMSDGTICTGNWEVRGVLGIGRSDIVCDDGRRARIWYTYRDGRTGTAVGTGRSNLGERINAWSGTNVADYLAPNGAAQPLSCDTGPTLSD